jgi:hypothetical protein
MFSNKLSEVTTSKNSFISDRLNLMGLGSALLINIIHWVILLSKIAPSDSNILLHYNVISGPDFVDKSLYVYAIPALALAVLVINFLLSFYFYRREKLATYFINFANIPIQIIFFVGSLVLIMING